jgi:hypothetical protein
VTKSAPIAAEERGWIEAINHAIHCGFAGEMDSANLCSGWGCLGSLGGLGRVRVPSNRQDPSRAEC